MIQLVWLIPLIMFSAAIINGLGVRKLGKIAGHVSWIAMAVCCAISFGVLFDVIGAVGNDHHWPGETVTLWSWFEIHNFFASPGDPSRTFSIDMAFRVDQLTAVFLCFISFIGTLVFIYATGYMKEKHNGHLELDPGYARFFAYVALFAASMFTLILGDNMVVMFIGWEGVGLCSYLLIGYFFDKQFSENLSCADAGRKAFVMNRIGDAGLIVGMGLLFWGLGTLNFQDMNAVIKSGDLPSGFTYGGVLITAATLCMFLGATGKSAQIPLFTWLPDAMAGPTPVSALIHAATMVTAGVYMVARMNVVFFMAPSTMAIIAIVGAITALAAATMGLTQRGIKKVLAYSTVSQLGYMFLGLGVGAMASGIFHVFTHAFFKGCLFLCAGSVIHAMHHEEDMFKMGGLRKYMPHTHWTYFIATLAIAGVFPLSGFFSKDEILFSAFISAGGGIPWLWIIGIATAFITAVYMGRSLFLTFWGKERMDEHTKHHIHESPANMTVPLWILAFFALTVGFLNVPQGWPVPGIPSQAAFHHFLSPVVDQGAEHVAAVYRGFATEGVHPHGSLVVSGAVAEELVLSEAMHHTEGILAVISFCIAIGGLLIAWFFFGKGISEAARKTARAARPLWSMSWHRWWWDDFYNRVFKDGTMALSSGVWKTDVALVDGLVVGAARTCRRIGESLRRIQTGQVQIYGLVMFIGICAFIVYFLFGMKDFMDSAWHRDAQQPPTAAIEETTTGPVSKADLDAAEFTTAQIISNNE